MTPNNLKKTTTPERYIFIFVLIAALLLFTGRIETDRAPHGTPKFVFPYQMGTDVDPDRNIPVPSGICWHPQRSTLFVVHDQGEVFELNRDGEVLHYKKFKPEIGTYKF